MRWPSRARSQRTGKIPQGFDLADDAVSFV
jgi:hypothetical protein